VKISFFAGKECKEKMIQDQEEKEGRRGLDGVNPYFSFDQATTKK
jgi:hypothetical protein